MPPGSTVANKPVRISLVRINSIFVAEISIFPPFPSPKLAVLISAPSRIVKFFVSILMVPPFPIASASTEASKLLEN